MRGLVTKILWFALVAGAMLGALRTEADLTYTKVWSETFEDESTYTNNFKGGSIASTVFGTSASASFTDALQGTVSWAVRTNNTTKAISHYFCSYLYGSKAGNDVFILPQSAEVDVSRGYILEFDYYISPSYANTLARTSGLVIKGAAGNLATFYIKAINASSTGGTATIYKGDTTATTLATFNTGSRGSDPSSEETYIDNAKTAAGALGRWIHVVVRGYVADDTYVNGRVTLAVTQEKSPAATVLSETTISETFDTVELLYLRWNAYSYGHYTDLDDVSISTPPKPRTLSVNDGANSQSEIKVNGAQVSLPVDVYDGDSYDVMFRPNDGYQFNYGVQSNFTGTVDGDLTVSGPDAKKTVGINVICGQHTKYSINLNGIDANCTSKAVEGDTYVVTFVAEDGYAISSKIQTVFSGTIGASDVSITGPDGVTGTPFKVVVADNTTATVKINGDVVDSSINGAIAGDTYEVVFSANENYVFEDDAVTSYSGTVGSTAITINGPSAIRLYKFSVTTPANSKSTVTFDGNVVSGRTTIPDGTVYKVTFSANDGYGFDDADATEYSGTAHADVSIDGPTPKKIVGFSVTCTVGMTAEIKINGNVVDNDITSAFQGDAYSVVFSVKDGYELIDAESQLTYSGTVNSTAVSIPSPTARSSRYRDFQYKTLGNDRVLLMNNDSNPLCQITGQGYYDTNTTASTYWVHEGNVSALSGYPASRLNLMIGTEHTLYQNENGSVRKLWQLVDCRAGSSADTNVARNYLPWSSSSKAMNVSIEPGAIPATWTSGAANLGGMKQVACVNMRATGNACLYSPYYDDGISCVYFDVVNSNTNNLGSTIEFQIATNVTANSAASSLESSENNDSEPDWITMPVDIYYIKNCDTMELQQKNATSIVLNSIGRATNGFYRISADVMSSLNDYAGPIKFRIKRTVVKVTANPDYNDLILIDNIIVSPPAMKIALDQYGFVDGTMMGKTFVGQGGMATIPFPAIGDDDVKARATYSPVTAGLPSSVTPKAEVSEAKCVYRERYLNQTIGSWKTNVMEQVAGEQSFVSSKAIPLPSEQCDIEYYFVADYDASHYIPVDYAFGNDRESPGYGIDEFALSSATLRRSGEMLSSGGTDYFFRLREGQSDYSHIDVKLYSLDDDLGRILVSTTQMYVTGDHAWRAVVTVPETYTDKPIWVEYVGHDKQSPGATSYDTNEISWGIATDSSGVITNSVPCNGLLSDETGFEHSVFVHDGKSSSYIFTLADDNATQPSYSITHGEYQNFNKWTDAHTTDGSFLSSEVSTSGVSMAMQVMQPVMTAWTTMTSTNGSNGYWEETFGKNTNALVNGSRTIVGLDTEIAGAFTTPNGFSANNGLYVAEQYKTNGISLQLFGRGQGSIAYDKSGYLPPGLDTVYLKARVGQFMNFDDFAYYWGDPASSNLVISAKAAMYVKKSGEAVTGEDMSPAQPSLSLVGYYVPNYGCYEARISRAGANFLEVSIYRWRNSMATGPLMTYRLGPSFDKKYYPMSDTVTNITTTSLGTTWTNLLESTVNPINNVPIGLNRLTTVYFSCCNSAEGTVLDIGIAGEGANTSVYDDASANKLLKLRYIDTSSSKLTRGYFGIGSRDCPARFSYLKVHKSNTALEANDFANTIYTVQPTEYFKTEDLYYYWAVKEGRYSNLISTSGGEDSSANPLYGFKSDVPSQTLLLSTRDANSQNWTNVYTWTINSFGFQSLSHQVAKTEECYVMLAAGGASADTVRTDVVVDDIKFTRWRGEDIDGLSNNYGQWRQWVYTEGWVTQSGSTKKLLLQPRRGLSDDAHPMSLRSPILTNGLSVLTFSWSDAKANAQLAVQIATNNVGSSTFYSMTKTTEADTADAYWHTIKTFSSSELTANSGAGTYTMFFDYRAPCNNMAVRLVIPTNVVATAVRNNAETTYGQVAITSVTVWDNPALDEKSWWGWNMRTAGIVDSTDSLEMRRLYLPDMSESGLSADAETEKDSFGLSGALNWTAGVVRKGTGQTFDYAARTDYIGGNDATYRKDSLSGNHPHFHDPEQRTPAVFVTHNPFIQSPAVNTSAGIGQVTFNARIYETNSPSAVHPAVLTLYGAEDPNAADEDWQLIKDAGDNGDFVITNLTFRPFTWKTTADSTKYRVIRLMNRGLAQYADSGNFNSDNLMDQTAKTLVQRVLVDEIVISEPVAPRMGFENTRPFRTGLEQDVEIENILATDQQPLLNESFGFQTRLVPQQMSDKLDLDSIEVYVAYYPSKSPWGWKNWTNSPNCVKAKLSRSSNWTSDNMVYRSSAAGDINSIVPAQICNSDEGYAVVQYVMWSTYRDSEGVEHCHYIDGSEWTAPTWYNPLDLNEGVSSDDYTPYTILEAISPKRAWFNEFSFNEGDETSSRAKEFLELAIPASVDMSGWYVNVFPLAGGGTPSGKTMMVLGQSGVPSEKSLNQTNSYAFLAVKSAASKISGTDASWPSLVRIDNGARDNSMEYCNPYAFVLMRPSGIYEHSVVLGGTNLWTEYSFGYQYDSYVSYTNLQAKLPKYDWVYIGDETSGGTLGVTNYFGSLKSDWCAGLKETPGKYNLTADEIAEVIDPAYYLDPNGTNVWVRAYVYGAHLTQDVGGKKDATQIFMLAQNSSTNIIYTADPWYRISSLDVAGASQADALQKSTYNLELKDLTGNVTITASAAVDDTLASEYGLTEDNPYTPAVLNWLGELTAADGEEKPFDPSYQMTYGGTSSNKLSLTEEYWMDINPFKKHLLNFDMSMDPQTVPLTTQYSGYSLDTTNVIIGARVSLTNTVDGGAAYHPTYLQGLGGEKSNEFTGNWTSETFKVVGVMPEVATKNNHWQWIPLRYFVFGNNSFDENHEAKIEIVDPHSEGSPAYSQGWGRDEYKGKAIWYQFDLDDVRQNVQADVLKADSTFEH